MTSPSLTRPDDDLPALADLWRWFADDGLSDCPIYADIARHVAVDADLLALAAEAPPEGRFPLMLLAAVHDLILGGLDHPLAAVYRGESAADPGPLFAEVCHAHREALLAQISRRHVQTNEVGRSAVIALAMVAAADAVGDPGGLVELGASAGLNLLFDRYRLDYGTGGVLGDAGSEVVAPCSLVGERPAVPGALPAIPERVGIDRAPVDLTDPGARRWLLACTWPGSPRLARAGAAHQLAAQDPPCVVAGDMVNDLAPLLAATAPGQPLAVVSTWAVAYLAPDDRPRVAEILAAESRQRPVAWISAEGRDVVDLGPAPYPRADGPGAEGVEPSVLGLSVFDGGARTDTVLALVHPHGVWADWLAD